MDRARRIHQMRRILSIRAVAACVFAALIPTMVPHHTHAQLQSVYPAIFDDFEYDSGEFDLRDYARGATYSGSIFGLNDWMTAGGLQRSRAWRRFNWDDLSYSCSRCGVIASEEGRIILIAEEGGVTGGSDHGRLPAVSSGFVTGGGTYAARIRMNALPEQGNYIQAFWTSGIDVLMMDQGSHWLGYLSETDIESFSRSYTGNNQVDFGVTNYLGKRMRQEGGAFRSYEAVVDGRYGVRSGDLQCVESEDGRWMRIVDCRDVLFDRDWIMNIRIQPREQVEYELRSADGRFAAGSVSRTRGGFTVEPVRVSDHSPMRPVMAVFGLYGDGEDQQLRSNLSMEIDWYYHTPSLITIDEVLEQVGILRSIHPRVNTLGLEFNAVTSQSDFEVSVQGPATLPRGRTGGWRLDLTHLNTTYVIERFDFSYFYCDDVPVIADGPFPIREPELTHAIPSRYNGMLIEAIVRNYWSGDVQRASKYVFIAGESCAVDVE